MVTQICQSTARALQVLFVLGSSRGPLFTRAHERWQHRSPFYLQLKEINLLKALMRLVSGSQNPRRDPDCPLDNLIRRRPGVSGALCKIGLVLSKLKQMSRRNEEVSPYNWNSFGLRYGKRLALEPET
uniref:Uncharacterized protein n=1 Tax=Callorhinchus milii TaxID=7868 RepID=A0A4W3JE04_CALMI